MSMHDEITAHLVKKYGEKLRTDYADPTPMEDQMRNAYAPPRPKRTEPSRWLCPPPDKLRMPPWVPSWETDIRRLFRRVQREGVNK